MKTAEDFATVAGQRMRSGSMTGSFHKPKEEAAGEPRESLAKRRARAKTMENLASGR